MAMGPKIDAHLKLKNNGKKVAVTGPTGGWDPYVKEATFAVVIGQVQDDEIVLAVGTSTAKPPDATWAATARVRDPNDQGLQLKPGWAYGWAIASAEASDDTGAEWYEPYEWSVITWLVAGNP
jgi:hypothetical protein